jgi:hypothetical protein
MDLPLDVDQSPGDVAKRLAKANGNPENLDSSGWSPEEAEASKRGLPALRNAVGRYPNPRRRTDGSGAARQRKKSRGASISNVFERLALTVYRQSFRFHMVTFQIARFSFEIAGIKNVGPGGDTVKIANQGEPIHGITKDQGCRPFTENQYSITGKLFS